MPTLDVSEILDDPEFSTTFVLLRRDEVVGANGRATFVTQAGVTVVGVVQPTGDDNVLTAEATNINRFIEIISKTPLRTAREGLTADRVVWLGNTYVVKSVADWSQWGDGFCEANAELLQLVANN
jgi:hypothetical protein